ncbi:hypothetical protein [Edaphobacter albus]|uniref:hypothetical protein n=1 Tax=Edaphobacter sp. 4G125 TaxID=2763071 RepID=UPI00210832EA|nr:hypothetical protein [Edaphobacter sp. 4G125]
MKNGATVISPGGYTLQQADAAVFAGSDAHPHDHITIYDGKQWVSDFKQRKMSSYRTAAPPGTIHRFSQINVQCDPRVCMTQKPLRRLEVRTCCPQIGRKRMAEAVPPDGVLLLDSGSYHCWPNDLVGQGVGR